MKHELFIKAIRTAQAALAAQGKVQFIASVRVAQAMAGDDMLVVRLLERCITSFPSARCGRILRAIARHCPLFTTTAPVDAPK